VAPAEVRSHVEYCTTLPMARSSANPIPIDGETIASYESHDCSILSGDGYDRPGCRPSSIYTGRNPGCYCNYCNNDGHSAAGSSESPRGRQPHSLPEQPAAGGHRLP